MKILLVDDQPGILEMLSLLLKKRKYEVMTAECGTDALRLLETETPDLIISDVQMPEMDGWELFEQVRLHPTAGTVPFIFLTGVSSPPNRVRGLKMGADDYISKPFDSEELVLRIERCLERQTHRGDTLPGGRREIGGRLGHLSLIDIIQILELNKRSATVTLAQDSDTAKVYLREGRVEGININGDFDARRFYQLLLWENAGFSVSEYVDEVPPSNRVSRPARELILESARLEDESRKPD